MKRILFSLFLMCACVCSGQAREKGFAPGVRRTLRGCVGLLAGHWGSARRHCDFELLGAFGVNFGAVSADAHTTNGGLRRCPRCEEDNPLLGKHPSRTRVWLVMTGVGVGYSALTWKMKSLEFNKEGKRDAPGLRWIVPAAVGFAHGFAAAHNAAIPDSRCASGAIQCLSDRK